MHEVRDDGEKLPPEFYMTRAFLPSIRSGLSAGVVAGLLTVLTLPAVHAAPQRPVPSAVGLWEQVDDDGRVGGWFHIYERDGIYEGKIVRMFYKPGEKPNPICTKCPGEQKNQPSLGLTLIKGMQRKGRHYENGTILDPRDGSIYQARMELSPDGQRLMVRGYLGIELFGQSQIWRRLPENAMAEIVDGAVSPPPTTVSPPSTGSARNAPAPQTGQPPSKR
jgi:uncharacterized protein (DUF2147 family)